MEHNKNDYILIDEEVAKNIPVNTIIFIDDVTNQIDELLRCNSRYEFIKYDNNKPYSIRIISIGDSNHENTTGFSHGCVLKSDLNLPSLLSLVEDDYLLIL